MSEHGNLTIVIQAGGESRRMGRSKATVPFLGEPLLKRGVSRMLPLADELIITTNEPENLTFLNPLIEEGKVRLQRDLHERRGAIRGIHTALASATNEYVALIACDMIYPSTDLIEAELAELMETGADVAIPETENGFEPFHGVYRREACLQAVLDAMEAGEERAGSLLPRVNTIPFSMERVCEIVPAGNCFVNTNTPEQLAAMEAEVLENEGPSVH